MPALFFALAGLLAWALQTAAFAPDAMQTQVRVSEAHATNFLAYHQAISDWAARHAWPTTAPVAADLNLPLGYVQMPDWRHQVVDGRLYTYTQAGYRQPPGFADVVRSVGTHACLRATDGSDTALCSTGVVALPPAVAAAVGAGQILIVGG